MTIFVGVVSSTVPVTSCVLAPAAKAAPLKARLATANKVIAVPFIVRKSRTSYPLIGAARSVASLKNRKRQIAISLQSVVLLWRRLRQYLNRDGINVSKAIPKRARFRFELRHCHGLPCFSVAMPRSLVKISRFPSGVSRGLYSRAGVFIALTGIGALHFPFWL